MFQYVAHRLNFDLQQVSLTLNNEEGRLVNYIATSVVYIMHVCWLFS